MLKAGPPALTALQQQQCQQSGVSNGIWMATTMRAYRFAYLQDAEGRTTCADNPAATAVPAVARQQWQMAGDTNAS
jgi:hypothetical protein